MAATKERSADTDAGRALSHGCDRPRVRRSGAAVTEAGPAHFGGLRPEIRQHGVARGRRRLGRDGFPAGRANEVGRPIGGRVHLPL